MSDPACKMKLQLALRSLGNHMPHRKPYCPTTHLSNMGIRVDYVEGLAETGLYYHDERRVEVRAGLHGSIERSVLAHEAMHAELRHEPQEVWCREARQERLANAMAGRNLIDYHQMVELQRQGLGEKQMCDELGVARVILRAYLWLTAPSWRIANMVTGICLPILCMPGVVEALA